MCAVPSWGDRKAPLDFAAQMAGGLVQIQSDLQGKTQFVRQADAGAGKGEAWIVEAS